MKKVSKASKKTSKPSKASHSFEGRSKDWAKEHHLSSHDAIGRFVLFSFFGALNRGSEEFILKGCNLLWLYIKTPRATLDLDLTTLFVDTHGRVKQLLEKSCTGAKGVQYSIQDFRELSHIGTKGAGVTMGYVTDEGSTGSFELDIIYSVPTHFAEIRSPVDPGEKIRAASVENIVSDKLALVQYFGKEHFRVKDFDDLWRLSVRDAKIDVYLIKKLILDRGVASRLNLTWIHEAMEAAWQKHSELYKDLPGDLKQVFEQVNHWLKSLSLE